MKFILFICISLLSSLFHVTAMPIHNIGDSPMASMSEMGEQHSTHQHAKMMESDHHQSENHNSKNHCPYNNHSCCLTLSIPFNYITSIALHASDEVNVTLSFPPPKIILETLYRPPKFFA